jgi:hypothetical protein
MALGRARDEQKEDVGRQQPGLGVRPGRQAGRR